MPPLIDASVLLRFPFHPPPEHRSACGIPLIWRLPTRRVLSGSDHLTQRLATPPVGSSDDARFAYGWLSGTRTDLGVCVPIRPCLMPVE